jgi:hypothetical protein
MGVAMNGVIFVSHFIEVGQIVENVSRGNTGCISLLFCLKKEKTGIWKEVIIYMLELTPLWLSWFSCYLLCLSSFSTRTTPALIYI